MKQLLAWLASLFTGGKKKKPPVIIVPPVIVPPVEPSKPPASFKWLDRRPIGMIMIAEWVPPQMPSDRKWKLLGKYQFSKEALMAHADECVQHMTELDAQAMLLWNGEGEEYSKPISYIGDIRILPEEIKPYIDEFFAKFKGFKTGVCIRPDKFEGEYWHEDGRLIQPRHVAIADHFADMEIKSLYAFNRWGCTIFYVDSNKIATPGTDNTVGHGDPIPAEVFARLHAKYPNFLFIPEHHRPEYYPHCAVWTKGAQIIPGALVVGEIGSADGLEAFIAAGNIPLFETWYKTDVQDAIKIAYKP